MMLLAGLIISPGLSQERREISQTDLEWIVQNLDLIVQGQIADMEEKLVSPVSLYGHGSDEAGMVITEITIQISEVLAGNYSSDKIKITLEEGELNELKTVSADFYPMDVKIGDIVIAGIVPNTRGTDYNILRHRRAFFKLEGKKLTPYQSEYHLVAEKPLETIREKARARQLPIVSKTADLICTGTVTRLIDPSSPVKEILVRIDETLKGTSEEPTITVNVEDVNRSFNNKKPGFHVMLFLKKSGAGYKTVEGVNGYYVIKGDKLCRGFDRPFKYNAAELKQNVKVWKEVER